MKTKQPLAILFLSLFLLSCNEPKKEQFEKAVTNKKAVAKDKFDEIFYLNYDIKKRSTFQPIHIDVANQFALVSKIGKNMKQDKVKKRECTFRLVEPKNESINARNFHHLKIDTVKYEEGPQEGVENTDIDHTIIFYVSESSNRSDEEIEVPFYDVKFKKNDIIDVIIKSSIKQISHDSIIKNKEFILERAVVNLGNHICRSIINDDDN